ncbi:hemerythrin [Methylomarinovum tepidoasis]|uniref:Hemerythrin n=1 Tax=Methylomarinovum tepidoasis TaxID=2840183 RepID=A0AAU9C016_9GAMM|nr:bacteriohemerythrin [Methylomarinovum sp. IN45]BCX89390.1 hemerythrin [Methylomarinovum sp. IN45]
MAIITWTAEQFGTNVGIADQQHQQIFDLLNSLDDAVKAGDRDATGKYLDELINVVVEHFKTEEDLMQQHGYPDYAAHKEAHDKLVATCADLQKKFHAGEADVTSDVTAFVKDWLTAHIPNIDKPYGPFLNEKGVN